MKVIVLASGKGGVGKTTLAAHLAVAAEQAGDGPVVMVDTDPQGSLADWWNAREQETPRFATAALDSLAAQLERLAAAGFALAVLDTPPTVTAGVAAVVRLADLVLVPARPSPHDLRAVGHTIDIIEAADRPHAFVVTMAKPAARLTAQAVAALSAHGQVAPVLIGDRVDFAASMTDGRTVLEVTARGSSAEEIRQLWTFTKQALGIGTKTRRRASTIAR